MSAPLKYRIDVQWSDADGAYVARVPALGYCAAHGATPDEAVREVMLAAEGVLEVMREDGDEIPEADINFAMGA